MKIKKERAYLKVNDVYGNPISRWERRATIEHNKREYMFFVDVFTEECWIEEITGGQIRKIDDYALWQEIANKLKEAGILAPQPPLITDPLRVSKMLEYAKKKNP